MKKTTELRVAGGICFLIALTVGGHFDLPSVYYWWVMAAVVGYEVLLVQSSSNEVKAAPKEMPVVNKTESSTKTESSAWNARTKVAAIVATGVVSVVGMYLYFSPITRVCVQWRMVDAARPRQRLSALGESVDSFLIGSAHRQFGSQQIQLHPRSFPTSEASSAHGNCDGFFASMQTIGM